MRANDESIPGLELAALGPTDRQVGANLLELRTKRGLSTTRLATALKEIGQSIPATGITRIEKGQRRVAVGELFALAVVLQVSPLTLLLPWPESPDADVEVTAVGPTTAREVWDWALGLQPPKLSETDPVGDLQRFPLDSLPPWARPIVSSFSAKTTPEQWKKLAAAGYLKESS